MALKDKKWGKPRWHIQDPHDPGEATNSRAMPQSHNGKVQTRLTNLEVNITIGKEKMTKKKYVEDSCHDDNRIKLSHTPKTLLIHL